MTDQKQEAGTLTLGERMILAARLAVLEHLRQSVSTVPSDSSYFELTDFSETFGEFVPYDDEADDTIDLEAELPESITAHADAELAEAA